MHCKGLTVDVRTLLLAYGTVHTTSPDFNGTVLSSVARGWVDQGLERSASTRVAVRQQPLRHVGVALLGDRVLLVRREPDALEDREGAQDEREVRRDLEPSPATVLTYFFAGGAKDGPDSPSTSKKRRRKPCETGSAYTLPWHQTVCHCTSVF